MKELLKKRSWTLLLAIGELALGVLMLVSPGGFTSILMLVLAIVLMALGVVGILNYARLPREEAARTWKLSAGVAGICVGAAALFNRAWLVEEFSVLTVLYGFLVAASAFLKVQMAVDAWRANRSSWYLMVISCVLSIAMATLLLTNPFTSESATWIFMGVSLLVTAVLDLTYFVIGRRSAHPKTNKQKHNGEIPG